MKVVKPIIISLAVIISIAIVSATVLAAIVFFRITSSDGIHIKNMFNTNSDNAKLVFEEKYEDKYKNIIITGDVADIDIKNSKDKEIHVLIYGEDASYDIKDEKELTIEVSSAPCKGLCINEQGARAEVFIPSTYKYEFNVDYKVGNMNVSDFKDATINIKLNTGNISVGDVNKVDVENKIGNTEISSAKNITINQVTGDIDIASVSEYLNITNKVGDVTINNITLKSDSKITNATGDILVKKIKNVKVNAKTNVGNKKIDSNAKDSKVKLDINNNIGDITVK